METKVRGAGTLSFWWKVSSASGDYLEFYINGLLQTGRIHGEVDWALKTYELPAGYHTLRWRYVKNSSGSENSDAGWIDQLTWSAAGGYNAWLASHFTPVEIADPAISGTTSDPDGDGATNLFEYAFGTDPDLTPASGKRMGRLNLTLR